MAKLKDKQIQTKVKLFVWEKRRKCMQILKVAAATNTFITCIYNICGVLRQLIVENKSGLYLEVTTLV